jgi:hypothetical protein
MFGAFHDSQDIGFPQDLHPPPRFAPESGIIPRQGVDFLAFVTDGFRALRRCPLGHRDTPVDGPNWIFGDARVEAALRSAMTDPSGADVKISARSLAEKLVDDARQFRRGYFIPEAFDDDRLVVVVDLRSRWRRWISELFAWLRARKPGHESFANGSAIKYSGSKVQSDTVAVPLKGAASDRARFSL